MKWVRLLAGLAFWFVVAAVVALLTAAGARPWGWLAVAVLFAVIPSQIAWTLSGRWAAVVTIAAGTALALALVALTPLPPSRLDGVVGDLRLPPTWVRTGRHADGGPFCVPSCPAVEHAFVAASDSSTALRSLVDAMRQKGFEVRVLPLPGQTLVRGRSGRVTLEARVGPIDPARTDVSLRLSSSPGNGELPVIDV